MSNKQEEDPAPQHTSGRDKLALAEVHGDVVKSEIGLPWVVITLSGVKLYGVCEPQWRRDSKRSGHRETLLSLDGSVVAGSM